MGQTSFCRLSLLRDMLRALLAPLRHIRRLLVSGQIVMQNKLFLPSASSGSDSLEYKDNRDEILPFVNVIDNFPTCPSGDQ